jgi:hypothetical protein
LMFNVLRKSEFPWNIRGPKLGIPEIETFWCDSGT